MKRVLVADDTKNIRTLVGKCLEMEGYEVTQAEDGPSAAELLRTERFDLAFLDIKMPGMSGTEVLKAIRAGGVDTPVIIITAYATVKNAVECTQMGAVAYLHKPFTADKLRAVLADLKENDSLTLAAQLVRSGKAQEALAALKKALADKPLNPSVYRLMAQASEMLGKTDDAARFRQVAEVLKKT